MTTVKTETKQEFPVVSPIAGMWYQSHATEMYRFATMVAGIAGFDDCSRFFAHADGPRRSPPSQFSRIVQGTLDESMAVRYPPAVFAQRGYLDGGAETADVSPGERDYGRPLAILVGTMEEAALDVSRRAPEGLAGRITAEALVLASDNDVFVEFAALVGAMIVPKMQNVSRQGCASAYEKLGVARAAFYRIALENKRFTFSGTHSAWDRDPRAPPMDGRNSIAFARYMIGDM